MATPPLLWSTPTTCLTQVSRQWGVGSRQRGRSAGQDEAFPVTGAAAAGKARQGDRARAEPSEFVNPTIHLPISDPHLCPICGCLEVPPEDGSEDMLEVPACMTMWAQCQSWNNRHVAHATPLEIPSACVRLFGAAHDILCMYPHVVPRV